MVLEIISDKLSQPILKSGRYINPWTLWAFPKFSEALKFLCWTKDESRIPSSKELDKTLPVLRPNFKEFEKSPDDGIRHLWIGHSSSLVQMDGITFMTDPIFSYRCFPSQKFGPKRFRPPPCSVEDLPPVDCVVISHSHYDHLDYHSVLALNKRFGDKLRWYVPQGLSPWMKDCGCQNVVQLSWWEEFKHSSDSDIRFVSTPAQHWCKRTIIDQNKVLWCSWCVLGPKHRFYFAGDTGYCPAFKEIGKKYGHFNLATIPIGAYQPREFQAPQHVDPSQAVDIHTDIRAEQSVGIHWGTFPLSKEYYLEPRDKIKEILASRKLHPSSFVTVKHGEICVFGDKDMEIKEDIS